MSSKKLKYFLFSILIFLFACSNNELPISLENNTSLESETADPSLKEILEDSYYYEKDELNQYIKKYDRLPDNYITKDEAKKIGWSIEDSEGLVIGGDRFANREKKLPEIKNRQYYEADLIEGYSSHRGPARLVYSNDGLVFYTNDHYDTFEELD